MELGAGHPIMSGQGQHVEGQPDAWTLFREGFVQPLFALQKHMPEITVGRSTDCNLSCPGSCNFILVLDGAVNDDLNPYLPPTITSLKNVLSLFSCSYLPKTFQANSNRH